MTFEELVKARYSVKKFDSKAVEAEKLQKIVEVAALAPTAKNAQSCRIYVLKSEEAMAKVNELTRCIYGAPSCLMFTYSKEEVFTYPGQTEVNSGAEDASIVATHAMFEAVEQGLGTCWVNFFNPQQVKEAFNLPEDQEVVLLMPVGYGAEGVAPLVNHEKKKPLSDVVIEL